MKIFMYFILLVVLLVGIGFACLNSTVANVNYYFGEASLPLSLMLVITFAFGGVFGLLCSLVLIIKQKANAYRLRVRIKQIEKELNNIRSMPLK